ncbi:MAG: hypothetical protein JNN04_06990 [Cyclobacteriaceae bacterium]|nr:hypothetical protein [Cyclobacteriaceae bacterium]
MWKLIIILVLVIYLLNKISIVLFRAFGRPPAPPPPFSRPQDGNIHANPNGRPGSKRGDIKGGEYVDYEEVK